MMGVTLVRIDDRLIHGQVVEAWIPALKIDRVIVVSDSAYGDETQAALMQLAMPESVDLEILPVREGAAAARAAAAAHERVMVLAPGPSEVLEMIKNGAQFGLVNVGGLHHAAGRVQLGKAIFLDERDAAALEAIMERGVRLEGRAVPSEPPSDISAMLRSARLS